MKKLLSVILLIALGLGSVACLPGTQKIALTCQAFRESPHQTRQITLSPGSTVTVELCSNPSTGYLWDQPLIPDGQIVTISSGEYRQPDRQMPGAAGTQVWQIKGQTDGVTRIEFTYSHPGVDDTPAWTFTLDVTVGSP